MRLTKSIFNSKILRWAGLLLLITIAALVIKNQNRITKNKANIALETAIEAKGIAEEALLIAKNAKRQSTVYLAPGETYGEFGQLIHKREMNEIACPGQDAGTAVILSIGQSNSANQGEQANHSGYGNNVVNFFDGKCYKADSPLLGASGTGGEWNTLLANKLIETQLFHTVVIISSGIGGSSISRWKAGGDLNKLMRNAVSSAQKRYKISFIIWHQGESDYQAGTDPLAYQNMFLSMVNTLPKVPIFVSIATNDGSEGWMPKNAIAEAQRQLIGRTSLILEGVNSDALLSKWDRSDLDKEHFTGTGQEKFASAMSIIIQRYFGKTK